MDEQAYRAKVKEYCLQLGDIILLEEPTGTKYFAWVLPLPLGSSPDQLHLQKASKDTDVIVSLDSGCVQRQVKKMIWNNRDSQSKKVFEEHVKEVSISLLRSAFAAAFGSPFD